MRRTWVESLMIWLPIVLALAVVGILCDLFSRPWLSRLLLTAPRYLSCRAGIDIWSGSPGLKCPFGWFGMLTTLPYWPCFLLPLLGWIKTRNRLWLIPQGLLVLAHLSVFLYFRWLWQDFHLD